MTTKQFEYAIATATEELGADRTSHIGVALSGGADSVALLTALTRLGLHVTALHCDFSLRGEESDGDRLYCERLARELGVELRQVKFDTHASRLPGESIEMTCRRLRYAWFEEQAREIPLSHIALGHHCEDSIETMLLNLTRGSGPKGLSGIARKRGIYIRPMLGLTRDDIEKYLEESGLKFRTDSTNLANDYRRNALRNVLIPKLYELIPTAMSGMMRTAEAMRHNAAMIETYLEWCAERYCRDGKIDIDAMRRDDIDLSGTLYMLIPEVTGTQAGMEVVEQILSEPGNRSSRLFPAGDGHSLELYGGRLEQYTEEDNSEYEITLDGDITSPVGISITEVGRDEFEKTRKNADTIWLDGSVLDEPHRFTLRHRRDGDRMRPFGAPGQRLISDIFTDLKMSRSEKNRAMILTIDDRPMWIVGIRASDMYKVTDNSKKIIKLQVR